MMIEGLKQSSLNEIIPVKTEMELEQEEAKKNWPGPEEEKPQVVFPFKKTPDASAAMLLAMASSMGGAMYGGSGRGAKGVGFGSKQTKSRSKSQKTKRNTAKASKRSNRRKKKK